MNETTIQTLPVTFPSARDLSLIAEMDRLAAEGDPRVLPPRRSIRAFIRRVLNPGTAPTLRRERTAGA